MFVRLSRYLDPTNPDNPRRLVKVIDGTLDGYVHGGYPHSMELFDPNDDSGRFQLRGQIGSRYSGSIVISLYLYMSRCMSVFAKVAMLIDDDELKSLLIDGRNRLEASDAYPA